MKHVLVLYYSQTGQLTRITRQITRALAQDPGISVTLSALTPTAPYPFPWTADAFLDVFPESLLQTPCTLQPLNDTVSQAFDLIILAFQVWYLSPSIPVGSFLQSDDATRLLNGRPVVTVIGCRNMWLLAHTKVQQYICNCGGRPVGNIVLEDHTGNLTGVVTIVHWMLTGRKKRLLGLLPLPGVAEKDILAADRFGAPICRALTTGRYADLQMELRALGAAAVKPGHILFETRLHRIFKVWARFIRRKGGPGDARRRDRLKLFAAYLVAAIVFFAPLARTVTLIQQRTQADRLRHLAEFFAGVQPPPDIPSS